MIPENFVAIQQAPDFRDVSGFQIVDSENTHKPNYGIVHTPPSNLNFVPYSGRAYKKGDFLDKIAQKARKRSLSVLSKMNLKEGDTVMYKYIYGIDDSEKFTDLLFVPYDDVYCKITPEIEMLNDYCLVRPDEKFVDELGGHFQKYRKGSGTLVKGCSDLIQYADYPNIAEAPPIGSYVHFKWTSAPKMEANIHQMLNKDGEYSLLKIRVKDIRYYINQ